MKSKNTTCVHAGQRRDSLGVVNPIEPSSAFQYIDEGNTYYPRYFNTPNQQYIIEKLAALENAESGLIFGSGMAAICTTLMTFLKPGDHAVLMESLYGGTLAFSAEEFDDIGIEYSLAEPTVDSLMSAVQENTRVIFVESPANPLMQIVDLTNLAKAAADRGIITIADNTFASPINQNPLDLGIDIVLHSGTKYLGGHSDLSFGVAVGNQENIGRIHKKAINYGGNLNALTCYLIERSIKTLAIRVQRQNENALKVAEFLESQPMVDQVYYAGLPSNEGHDLAASQMHDGFGGMVSFEITKGLNAKTLLMNLKLFTAAMSLGGIESTVTMPVHTSHKRLPSDERERLGISDRLVRLSVGIEEADDIINDLAQAFKILAEQNSVAHVS